MGEIDFMISSPENGGSMTQRFSFLLYQRGVLFVPLVVLALLVGCKKKQAAAGGAPAMPPTQVIAAEAKEQSVAETLAVVGTLAANEFIEVKSETDGTIAEILFDEGQPIKKGDPLIRLDETKFSAALAEAEANLPAGIRSGRIALSGERSHGSIAQAAIAGRAHSRAVLRRRRFAKRQPGASDRQEHHFDLADGHRNREGGVQCAGADFGRSETGAAN